MESNPIKDFWTFINNPSRREYSEQVANPLSYVTTLFAVAFAFSMFAMIIVNSVFVDLNEIGNALDGLDFSYLKMIFVVVLGAPIVEELIFRLPLRNTYALSFVVAVIFGFLVSFILISQGFEKEGIVAGLAVFLLFLAFLKFNKDAWQKWMTKIDDFYPYIFFSVAGLFAFMHIYNYDASAFSWWMAPMIVIPQFVLGLFLGFVRLRVGFWACIYMHAVNNLIPTLMLILSEFLPKG